MISFDGVNDHLPLMARTQFIDDVTSNKSIGGGWFLSEGTRVYVKEIGTPSSGSVYLSIFYGAD